MTQNHYSSAWSKTSINFWMMVQHRKCLHQKWFFAHEIILWTDNCKERKKRWIEVGFQPQQKSFLWCLKWLNTLYNYDNNMFLDWLCITFVTEVCDSISLFRLILLCHWAFDSSFEMLQIYSDLLICIFLWRKKSINVDRTYFFFIDKIHCFTVWIQHSGKIMRF